MKRKQKRTQEESLTAYRSSKKKCVKHTMDEEECKNLYWATEFLVNYQQFCIDIDDPTAISTLSLMKEGILATVKLAIECTGLRELKSHSAKLFKTIGASPTLRKLVIGIHQGSIDNCTDPKDKFTTGICKSLQESKGIEAVKIDSGLCILSKDWADVILCSGNLVKLSLHRKVKVPKVIQPKILESIAESIIKTKLLQKLTLSGLGLGVAEAIEIAKAVRIGCITHLDLSYNHLSNQGIKAISLAIKKSGTIVSLKLADNNIDYSGCKYLAEAIPYNTELSVLNLKINKIKTKGAVALFQSMEKCERLTRLNFSENSIEGSALKHLVPIAKKNPLIKLSVAENKIGVVGAGCLAKILKESQKLQVLNASDNQFTKEGGKMIAEAIKEAKSLTLLNLVMNHLRYKGVNEIIQAATQAKLKAKLKLNLNDLTYKEFMHFAEGSYQEDDGDSEEEGDEKEEEKQKVDKGEEVPDVSLGYSSDCVHEEDVSDEGWDEGWDQRY
eukprot:TRINITY_DN2595_c0_g1_i1.p3 TRINITY_DN2595_c0_g1~~TRINITY_DN2595_c0_g1_i1.p3  ORF type:complete len:539 (-),score=71.37 TRINITY_DN2595_c0_g1_i1:8611-10110(-)